MGERREQRTRIRLDQIECIMAIIVSRICDHKTIIVSTSIQDSLTNRYLSNANMICSATRGKYKSIFSSDSHDSSHYVTFLYDEKSHASPFCQLFRAVDLALMRNF